MADPVPSTRSTAAPGLVVLRPKRHAALLAALDAAVAQDPALAAPRSLLLTPLSLLGALAKDAEGALGDDVLAAERLRLLLALAATQMPPLAAIRAVMGGDDKLAASSTVPAVPCEDGVIDMGGLVVVALAAGRVGKQNGLAEPLVNNVLGLAIAAGPAEALARSLAAGMAVSQVRALLAGLGGVSDNGQDRRLSASIASFLTDPCERARWACLELLFTQVRADVAETTWDAAGTGSILAVDPPTACPGQPVTLRVEPAEPPIIITLVPSSASSGGSGQGEAVLDSAHFLPLLERDAAEVVFASQGYPSVSQLPEAVDAETGIVGVIVPEGARAGWIGFADPALRATSNQQRERLRLAWSGRNASLPALRGGPVPVARIPDLPSPPTPPRAPRARFDGGAPVILEASIAPAVVDPGAALRLSWRVAGARQTSIDPSPGAVEPEGWAEVAAPTDRASVAFTLSAQGGCGEPVREALAARVRVRIRRVDVAQAARASSVALRLVGTSASPSSAVNVSGALLRAQQPVLVEGEEAQVVALLSAADAAGTAELVAGETTVAMAIDAGRATGTIPAALAADGLTGTVIYRGPDGGVEDRRDFGPLRFVPLRTRTLVLVRPAAIGRDGLLRASPADVLAALEDARAKLAIDTRVTEPAWIDDEDLALTAAAEGRDVPATLEMLERLNALAARCPGFEESTWVAVVPTPPAGQEFFRMEPADGARAVAVSTPGALGKMLDAEPPAAAPRTLRLRIAGTLEGDGSVRLQPLRAEERGGGPGSPAATDLRVVGLDRAGRVRTSAAVRAMTDDRPARAVVLLPVTEDVVAMEIRREGQRPVIRFCAEDEPETPPVRRVDRLPGAPEVLEVEREADGDRVTFGYNHTGGINAIGVMEIGSRERGWSPVLRIRRCADHADIPLGRLTISPEDELRIAATDGWSADTAPDDPDDVIPVQRAARRVVARHAGGLRFWADFDAEGYGGEEVTWTFGDRTETGILVTVPPDHRGDVVLTVRDGGIIIESAPTGSDDGAASDTRTIGADGKVDDRSTLLPEDGRYA